MASKRWGWSILVLLMLSLVFSACGGSTGSGSGATGGKVTIKLFFHSGTGPERDALNASLKAFQAQDPNIIVDAVQLPEGSYNDQVHAAALAHNLPCLLDFDGPNLYNYAWSGYLIPLDKYVSASMKADFLPSIIQQGTYAGHLYSLGQFDSGLGFYGNKKYLTEAGVRLPTIDHPWTLNELNDVLAKLKKVPGVTYPLNLQLGGGGEWYTYAFSSFLQSFGGDLIDRSNYQSASGVLNGPAAAAWGQWFQSLIKQGYVNPKPITTTSFTDGTAALVWDGHWDYPTNSKALGSNLLALPAPNLGHGAKTGMGSWNFGITSSCKNPDQAWTLLNFLLSDQQIAAMTTANGAVPARKSALAQSSLYASNGPLHVFVQQLEGGVAVPRPITPAYPAITTAFQTAVANIVDGANVQAALNTATQQINQNIQDHNGYPLPNS
jgi:multiple sugar transport system substrate-binding protein